jgi:glutaredoxin/uncharacterized protein YdbL (DUF1318 family)
MNLLRLHAGAIASAIALTLLAAAPAHAGPIDDAFRGFLDRMRGEGQTLRGVPQLGATREVKKLEFNKRTDNLPLGQKQIAVFVDNGCRSCNGAVADLKKRGFHVEVFNLSTSESARQSFALTGAKGVPAVLIGTQVMSGYSDKLLQNAMAQDAAEQGNAMQGQGS